MVTVDSELGPWPAPAKLNLFLHVVGQREDGYHLLQTIFQFIDFADELFFTITDDGVISRSYDYGFSEQQDLCLRAAHLLKPFAKSYQGVSIKLYKRLPMGGGLGGGSSDAATVLIALNQLWGLGLSRLQLAEIGLELGADVPVFIMGQAAWAEGIGEQLTPIKLYEPWYLVLIPNVEISTAQVFSNKHLTATPRMKKIRALESTQQSQFGENQLQDIVVDNFPEVAKSLDWLLQFGPARMTGSGACVFMPVADRASGMKILKQRPENSDGFVAKGLNIHPLFDGG